MLLRFLSYGIFGWCAEIVWSAVNDAVIRGDRRSTGDTVSRVALSRSEKLRLEGKTYLWMFPVYGFGGLLFELVHAKIVTSPWLLRGAIYCAGAFAVEAASGWLLKLATGRIPWDYSYARFSWLGGAIRLDYAPVWFAFGFLLERVEAIARAIEPVL